MAKLWAGRTDGVTAKIADDFNSSVSFDSRMYRVLRAYSFISSATALVGNDNYIDNLALGSSTPLSYDSVNRDLWRRTSGSELASATIIGDSGSVNGRRKSNDPVILFKTEW